MYSKYSAMIFDMDGTIVDSGALHQFAWTRSLNEFNLPIEPKLMRSLVGVPTKDTVEIIVETFNIKSGIDSDKVNEFKEALVRQHYQDYVKSTQLESVARDYHGAIPMAIGTGAYTEEAINILNACGLGDLFEVVIGADQIENPKPAPDTFLKAASELGVDPQKCVVFEDSPLGIQAALKAGMDAVDVLEEYNIINNYFLDP